MPDGDRFEWRLRGKGWRRVYRLQCSGADDALVADHAIKSVAAYLRTHTDTSYRGFLNALTDALSAPTFDSFPPESGLSGATGLTTHLETEVVAHKHSEAAQLAQRAAWKTFLRLDSERQTLTRERIAETFAGEFTFEITERRCLGVMREQVIEKTNRTLEDQVAKEASLKECIRSAGQQFGKQLDSEKPVEDVRAPRKSVATRDFTVDDLNKPLNINVELQ